jgi:hypothetical protein
LSIKIPIGEGVPELCRLMKSSFDVRKEIYELSRQLVATVEAMNASISRQVSVTSPIYRGLKYTYTEIKEKLSQLRSMLFGGGEA